MSDAANKLIDTALQFHRQGRLDEAHGIYRQITREYPDHAHAHHLLGLAERHRGDEQAANRSFIRAVELDPDEALFRATLADSCRVLGDTERAREQLERLSTDSVDDPDLRVQIGTLWGLLGETGIALDYCRPVTEMFPDHGRANLLLGSLLYDQGDFAEAMARLEKIRTTDPNIPDPTCALAATYVALGRYDRVIALSAPRDPRQMFGEGAMKALSLWLTDRAAECRQFVTAARAHGQKLPDWPRKGVFLGMLEQLDGLSAYRDRHAPSYESAAHAVLPVIGDEQSVAAHGFVVTLGGRSTRLTAHPVHGCRARHLVGGANRFQAAYLAALDRLAPGDRFASLVGSLDCRVGGLLAELPVDSMGRWTDFSRVDALAADYVAWLAEAARARNLSPIVMGVPGTNVQTDVMKVLSRNAYLTIIERINRALREAATVHGLAFADLYAATDARGGVGRPVHFINATYLLPKPIATSLAAALS